MKSHEELEVWRKAIDLADLTYDVAAKLPSDERYGLSDQIRRSSVSVPANIAEGAGRDSTREFLKHLSIARGSLAELTTHFVIIGRRRFVTPETLRQADDLAGTVGRLLSGLQRSLRRRLKPQ